MGDFSDTSSDQRWMWRKHSQYLYVTTYPAQNVCGAARVCVFAPKNAAQNFCDAARIIAFCAEKRGGSVPRLAAGLAVESAGAQCLQAFGDGRRYFVSIK